jgi:hypothetical protein
MEVLFNTVVQVVPLVEVIILTLGLFELPFPTATHKVPFHATPFPLENIEVLFVIPVQIIPLDEYAMLLFPEPTAIVGCCILTCGIF